MMSEDYVSFEIAKLLKEKGFDEPCDMYINEIFPTVITKYSDYGFKYKNSDKENSVVKIYSAPTIQMAMKWLREVYNLFIQITIIPYTTVTMEQKYNLFSIHKDRRMLCRSDIPTIHYAIYEEACEAAIKYCLENLI